MSRTQQLAWLGMLWNNWTNLRVVTGKYSHLLWLLLLVLKTVQVFYFHSTYTYNHNSNSYRIKACINWLDSYIITETKIWLKVSFWFFIQCQFQVLHSFHLTFTLCYTFHTHSMQLYYNLAISAADTSERRMKGVFLKIKQKEPRWYILLQLLIEKVALFPISPQTVT